MTPVWGKRGCRWQKRNVRGLSQEQLAETAELHHTFIGNVKRGKVNASAYSKRIAMHYYYEQYRATIR